MKRTKQIARALFWLLAPACLLLALAWAPAGVLLGAATLTSFQITASAQWNLTSSVTGLSNSSSNNNSTSYAQALTSGTGASGTANLLYYSQTVLAASANTTITFSGGATTDFFGNAMTFARVKYVYINNNNATTASSITVGNATHPLPLFGISLGTTTLSINNNGFLCGGDPGATGMAVGSGATDSIKIVNADGANSATVNIVAVGSTA